jgi:hypothetical protein
LQAIVDDQGVQIMLCWTQTSFEDQIYSIFHDQTLTRTVEVCDFNGGLNFTKQFDKTAKLVLNA